MLCVSDLAVERDEALEDPEAPPAVLLELGPGSVLTGLARKAKWEGIGSCDALGTAPELRAWLKAESLINHLLK